MLIPNRDLTELVKTTCLRATPADGERVRLIVHTLEQSGLTADSGSESSKGLQRLVATHRSILTPAALEQLDEVLVFGIELLLCDAFPRKHRGRACIFVCDGLLRLLQYYTELQQLMALLVDVDAAPVVLHGERTNLSLAASLAGHASFVANIESGHQPFDISSVLGPVAVQRAKHGYDTATLFFVLHELGHLVCGHLDTGYVSERVAIEIPVPETLNQTRQMELEADAFALGCIAPEVRNLIISSIGLALGPFASLEMFSGAADAGHPLSVNRLARLADQVSFPENPELAEATRNIVSAEVQRFERLAPQRTEGCGDLRYKVHENMPLDLATEVMAEVVRRVKTQFGTLDFPATEG